VLVTLLRGFNLDSVVDGSQLENKYRLMIIVIVADVFCDFQPGDRLPPNSILNGTWRLLRIVMSFLTFFKEPTDYKQISLLFSWFFYVFLIVPQ